MRIFIALLLTFSSQILCSQEEEVLDNVGFAVIEKVPVYPGCKDGTNEELKNCMSQKISTFVGQNFNIRKGSKGLKPGVHRVYVNFKIDKTGQITNIKSRAPSPKLEQEAIRVIKKLPQMIPGQQKGKNVGVIYSLPITFEIEDSKRKKKG